MDRKLRIIYMGTPEFAVEPLRAITSAGYNVLAVITAPDKPAGRGQKIHASPVKEFAVKHNIPVLQPVKLKDPDFIAELKSFDANLMVVVAFRMLPEMVWQMPEYGTLNLHASLLPQYRGAAPINHAIINGETETGLTTFFIEQEIDTGKIILSRKMPILSSDDAGSLHDRMMIAGGDMILETLKMIETGNVKPQSQAKLLSDNLIMHPAPKIFKQDCRINWDRSSISIHNLVRGLSPFPGAFSKLVTGDQEVWLVKIFKTTYQLTETGELPGTVITDYRNTFSVIAGDGIIDIKELQLEGKKRISTPEFLRGIHSIDRYHFE